MNWRSIFPVANLILAISLLLWSFYIQATWVYPQAVATTTPATFLFLIVAGIMVIVSIAHYRNKTLNITPRLFVIFWVCTAILIFAFGAAPYRFENSTASAILDAMFGVIFATGLFVGIIERARKR